MLFIASVFVVNKDWKPHTSKEQSQRLPTEPHEGPGTRKVRTSRHRHALLLLTARHKVRNGVIRKRIQKYISLYSFLRKEASEGPQRNEHR